MVAELLQVLIRLAKSIKTGTSVDIVTSSPRSHHDSSLFNVEGELDGDVGDEEGVAEGEAIEPVWEEVQNQAS